MSLEENTSQAIVISNSVITRHCAAPLTTQGNCPGVDFSLPSFSLSFASSYPSLSPPLPSPSLSFPQPLSSPSLLSSHLRSSFLCLRLLLVLVCCSPLLRLASFLLFSPLLCATGARGESLSWCVYQGQRSPHDSSLPLDKAGNQYFWTCGAALGVTTTLSSTERGSDT